MPKKYCSAGWLDHAHAVVLGRDGGIQEGLAGSTNSTRLWYKEAQDRRGNTAQEL